jgi:hypothetical protein
MEIIPSAAILVGCWTAVTGLTRALLWVSNDRVRSLATEIHHFEIEKDSKLIDYTYQRNLTIINILNLSLNGLLETHGPMDLRCEILASFKRIRS